MPYIKDHRRRFFDQYIEPFIKYIDSEGELTYIVYKICLEYAYKNKVSFAILSNAIKALECAKLEFYRKELAPYEDEKIKENGDVTVTMRRK